MITEFIGQGLTDETDESAGNYICSSLKNELFTEITFFVAFLRSKGLKELKPFIKKAKSENRKITCFVGIDENITSKEALEMLIDLEIDSYIYNSSRFIFHPKVYVFEGELRNRIIVGSSNLTKTGLFFNVESSLLLDFTSEDKSGTKVLNQLKDYFAPLLDFTSESLEKVTTEHIKYLLDNKLISIEKYESDVDGYFVNTHDESKKKTKNPIIADLGNIVVSENKSSSKKYELKITEEYLEKWDTMFERMKIFQAQSGGRTTVPIKYYDKTLYGWYRKQKDIYNHPTLKMPKEHLEKLESIGFYFGDGHDERTEFIKNKWLKLLREAIKNNEDISQDHRYYYKGEGLGTWLQMSKSDKVLRKEIEQTGFDYSKKSRKPEFVAGRFIDDLLNAKSPKKVKYQTRFNTYIRDKKDVLSDKIIEEINTVWELQFNETRDWVKQPRVKDKTEEWKQFRYDKQNNPEGKWFKGKSHMGYIYEWVWGKKRHKRKMDLVIDKFNDTEKSELRNEGFPID